MACCVMQRGTMGDSGVQGRVTLTCWSMDGPEEDDPLFCGSTGALEAVLSAAIVIVMMEGVWLTIYVGRCL